LPRRPAANPDETRSRCFVSEKNYFWTAVTRRSQSLCKQMKAGVVVCVLERMLDRSPEKRFLIT
jgi:hypothetical protein